VQDSPSPLPLLYDKAKELWGALLAADKNQPVNWLMVVAFSDWDHGPEGYVKEVDTGSQLKCWACDSLVKMHGPFLIYPVIAKLAQKYGSVQFTKQAGGRPVGWEAIAAKRTGSSSSSSTFSRQRGPRPSATGAGKPSSTFMVACCPEHADVLAKALKPGAAQAIPCCKDTLLLSGRIYVHGVGPVGTVIPGTAVQCAPVLKHPLTRELELREPDMCSDINMDIRDWISQYKLTHGQDDGAIPTLDVPGEPFDGVMDDG
jgi:hypothetical protein